MRFICNIPNEIDYMSSDLGIIRASIDAHRHCKLELLSSFDEVEEFLTSGTIDSCEAYLTGIDNKESLSINEVETYFAK